MAEVTTVEVPDIGDFTDVPVVEILVEVGQEVAEEDPLVALESDKATMEVPSPSAGKVAKILIEVGSEVSQGTPIKRVKTDSFPVAASALTRDPFVQLMPAMMRMKASTTSSRSLSTGRRSISCSSSICDICHRVLEAKMAMTMRWIRFTA